MTHPQDPEQQELAAVKAWMEALGFELVLPNSYASPRAGRASLAHRRCRVRNMASKDNCIAD